jgi:hypothetical protein
MPARATDRAISNSPPFACPDLDQTYDLDEPLPSQEKPMKKYRVELARELIPDHVYVDVVAPTFAQAERMALDDAKNNRVNWNRGVEVRSIYVTDVHYEGIIGK